MTGRAACLLALVLASSSACATASDVDRRGAAVLARTEADKHGLCPAEPLALAHAEVAFARLASARADGAAAHRHLVAAEGAADEVARLRPSCPVVGGAYLPSPAGPNGANGRTSPNAPDGDADGVPDASDRCLTEREDLDGWLDDDGCPELDNDGDGASDVIDRCPSAPEDKDGFEDLDGCPEPGTSEPPESP